MVVGADEAPTVAAAIGDPSAAMAAVVEERVRSAIAAARHEDGRAEEVANVIVTRVGDLGTRRGDDRRRSQELVAFPIPE